MLNRCPSCQASVLDDDEEVCPFCGSPMDPAKAKGFKSAAGGPAATQPAARPAAAKSAPSPKSVPTPKPAAEPRQPVAAKAAAAASDDDPFSIDRKSGANVIALSPKRTQQRPHKVVCPMCDTPGYASESASAKEVRCANPKCLVPVFKAPDFAAPKAAEPEPPASAVSPTVITFGLVGLILVGAAVWWFGLREPARPSNASPVAIDAAPTSPLQSESPGDAAPAPTSAEQAPPRPSPEQVVEAALARWPAVADDITEAQRQPLRRRLAAEAFAIAGRPDAAREQIDRLAATRSAGPFYQITPLAELAWLEALGGDDANAKAAFEQAAPLAAQIPPQGFDPARVAVDWSAAATRFGAGEAARDLAATARDDAAGEQLLTMLRSAALFSDGDLDAEHALRPVRPWSVPKSTAVTFELSRRNAGDAGLRWAEGAIDPVARAESLAAWAEAAVVTSGGSPEVRSAAADPGLAAADAAERTFAEARAAVRLAGRSDGEDAAAALLARVTAAAGGFPPPTPLPLPDLTTASRVEMTDPTSSLLRGLALGEGAHAASLLGRKDEAADLLSKALEQLRSSVPSVAAVTERTQELESLGISGVQRQLKSALGSASDDQAREAANAYRRKLGELQTAAAGRFDARAALLARAVEWGLGPQVLAEAQRGQSAADPNSQDAFLSGDAGGRLLAAFQTAGDAAAAQAVRDAGVTDRNIPPAAALELALAGSSDQRPAAVAQDLSSQKWSRVSRSERLSAAIRAASRRIRGTSAADAIALAAAVRPEAGGEEALRYVALHAARAGAGGEVQEALPKLRLGPTEEAAVLRGLVEGAVAARESASGPASPAATPPKTPGAA